MACKCAFRVSKKVLDIYPWTWTRSICSTGPIYPGSKSLRTGKSESKISQRSSFHTSAIHQKDYYEVLGVSRNASKEEIKKAFLKKCKLYHPDKIKDDQSKKEEFHQVKNAYDALMKGEVNTGMGAESGGFGSYASSDGFKEYKDFYQSFDPDELFRNIFGSATRSNQGFGNFAESNFGFAPASEVFVDLTFEEAVRGCNKQIAFNISDTCTRCGGDKAEPGTKKTKCHHCNGTGMETISNGPFIMQSTCRYCHGSRFLIKCPCVECQGSGKTIQRKNVTVPVPAGVEDGQTVRMPLGKKEIFITFKVTKSNTFRREGADIHSDVIISLSQAVLGGTVRVKGIYEDINLNIPAGTSSHTKIRMAGKGASRPHSYGHGDHYVHVKVKVPTSLSAHQKALLLTLAEMETGVNGTINGLAETKTGEPNKKGGTQDGQVVDEDDESFLTKIKRKLFG